MLQLLPHSGQIVGESGFFGVCLALMDKSITPSLHATADYRRKRAEKQALIKIKME